MKTFEFKTVEHRLKQTLCRILLIAEGLGKIYYHNDTGDLLTVLKRYVDPDVYELTAKTVRHYNDVKEIIA